MHYIKRHSSALDEAELQERLDDSTELVELQLKIAQNQPEQLYFSRLIDTLREYIGYLSILDGPHEEIGRALRIMNRACALTFQAALTPDEVLMGHLETRQDEKQEVRGLDITVRTARARMAATLDHWFIGFYTALICRDQATLDMLALVPRMAFQHSDDTVEECLYLFMETLQAFWKHDQQTSIYLEKTLQITDPEQLTIDPQYILYLVVPEIELLFHILTRSEPGFQGALIRALEQFRLYWSDPDQRARPQGWLALAPLAYTALAYDLSVAINVSSEYIPAWIYEGLWLNPITQH